MTRKLKTVVRAIDFLEEEYYPRLDREFTSEERDILYWLFDNDIKFTISARNNDIIIKVPDEIDAAAFKLRWS